MFNKSQDGAVYRVSRSEKENSLGEKLFPLFLQISLLIEKIESYMRRSTEFVYSWIEGE